MDKKKLFLGNLKYGATEADIRPLIANCGDVVSIKLFEDKGFGFIEMADEAGAENVINELNGKEVKGRAVRIDYAKPQRR